MGAEGVVVREMETRISERSCPIVPFGKDHVVEATILGTAIAQFARMQAPPVYSIHKMSDGGRRRQAHTRQMSVSLEGGEKKPEAERPRPSPAPAPQSPAIRVNPATDRCPGRTFYSSGDLGRTLSTLLWSPQQ